eukprot:7963408-Pyramimonas_sp.AAC.1
MASIQRPKSSCRRRSCGRQQRHRTTQSLRSANKWPRTATSPAWAALEPDSRRLADHPPARHLAIMTLPVRPAGELVAAQP